MKELVFPIIFVFILAGPIYAKGPQGKIHQKGSEAYLGHGVGKGTTQEGSGETLRDRIQDREQLKERERVQDREMIQDRERIRERERTGGDKQQVVESPSAERKDSK